MTENRTTAAELRAILGRAGFRLTEQGRELMSNPGQKGDALCQVVNLVIGLSGEDLLTILAIASVLAEEEAAQC